MNKKKKSIKKTPYDIRQNTAYFVKNRLPAFILAGLIIFWTIASIFGIIGYCRSKPKNTAMITASAQTVGDYSQAQYRINLYQFNGLVFHDGMDYFAMNTEFEAIIGVNRVEFSVGGEDYEGGQDILFEDIPFISSIPLDFNSESFSFEVQNSIDTYALYDLITYDFVLADTLDAFDFTIYFNDSNNVYPAQVVRFSMLFSFELPLNMFTSITIGHPPADGLGYYNLKCGVADIGTLTYYYKYFVGNQNSYQNGYDEGYKIGSTQINQGSYNSGYNKGYAEGAERYYDIGYEQGVNSAHEYTFDSLLSSVFDVPVRVFTSLFNFEILGVNLASFFLSILTLCAVLAVVKMLI